MSNRTGGDTFALTAARHAMNSSEMGSENYGALPSSYRRIRKSKSFVTFQHSNLRLRLQRSVPFLRRQSTTTFSTNPEEAWERHEEAVELARAQYFSASDSYGPSETGLVGLRRGKRDEKHQFRKSVRGSEILSVHQTAAATRSFSATLRSRVRKVIGRTLKRKNSLPPQQLEAQRNHFLEFDPDTINVSGFDTYQMTDYTPRKSESAVPDSEVLEDLDKLTPTLQTSASRESLHSHARSRVTSWTNSSATGSVSLRSGPIERNRLSIIKEDGGPHQPSSSAGRHIGGVDSCEPLRSAVNNVVPASAVNSQRIYSALIKRINEEEEEVQRTKFALDTINQEREVKELHRQESTIRAVQSNSSLAILTKDLQSRHFSGESDSSNHAGLDTADEQLKENAGKRLERLVEQETQSSFFPFSSEKSPNTPSPFKKFLTDRRTRTRSRSRSKSRSRVHDEDGGRVVVKRYPSNSVMNRPRFGLSSASVYSRTTNGGSNDHYQRPIDSSDDLPRHEYTDSEISTGTANLLPTTHASCDHTERHPWSEPFAQDHYAPGGNSHTREKAQISSREEATDGDEMPGDKFRGRSPLIDLVTPVSRTPKLHITFDAGHAKSELLKKRSVDALSNISNRAEDGNKGDGSLRKLSPGNLARMFKQRKNEKQSRPPTAGKENSPAARQDSPPLSTPGRLHLQFRNGSSTGRLRKRASENGFQSRPAIYSTPTASISTITSLESPSENIKHHLVARLSRPFNMDVPPQNRPFDSMYLGKRTPGHPDIYAFSNNRLSVAPRVSEKSSNSGRRSVEEEPITSSVRTTSAGRGAASLLGLLGSKRMVSNFLRSRRGDRSTSASNPAVPNGSPAFI